MSSAVLYLAIVAIWAGFLIPAWIRRPHGSRSAGEAEFAAESQTDAKAGGQAADSGLIQAGVAAAEAGGRDHDGEYVGDVPDYPDGGVRSAAMPPATRPSQSRQQMMHARRRMLMILVGLTVFGLGLTGIGLVSWWICLPPIGLLVFYLLLLREIAMAEAENAVKRQQAHRASVERERARDAWAASHSEPTAQIIDISSRVGDQLYDQYADATVRAVGD